MGFDQFLQLVNGRHDLGPCQVVWNPPTARGGIPPNLSNRWEILQPFCNFSLKKKTLQSFSKSQEAFQNLHNLRTSQILWNCWDPDASGTWQMQIPEPSKTQNLSDTAASCRNVVVLLPFKTPTPPYSYQNWPGERLWRQALGQEETPKQLDLWSTKAAGKT